MGTAAETVYFKEKNMKKIVLTALTCVFAAGVLFAGGGSQEGSGTGAKTGGSALNFSGYPMTNAPAISWWNDQYTLGGRYATADQSPFHSGLEKHLGVDINWIFPTEGTPASQAFNLMLADNVLPDIIAYGGLMAEGDRYIDEGVIMDLTPYIEKYAPNYWKYLKANPVLDRAARTDSGKYFAFLFFREDWGWNDTYMGFMIRKDWLDECGLPVPETMVDWDKTIRTFKQRYGATFAAPSNRHYGGLFAGAYGAYGFNFGLYVDKNGKIQCVNTSAQYKNFLTKLNEWWREGLIDPDLPASSDATARTAALNGKIGAAYSALSQLSIWRNDAQEAKNGANWVAAKYPKGNDGTLSMVFGGYGIIGFPATLSAGVPQDRLETALRALDYGYSPEGILYWNFGTKGVTWDYDAQGKVVYLPLVTDDPEGLTIASGKYSGAVGYGTCVQTTRLIQIRLVPEAVEANDLWYYPNQGVTANYTIPPGVSYTPEESARRAELQTALGTYAEEMKMKFLTGQEPLSNFEPFVSQLNRLGLPELIRITQAAYDRYMKR
jgi:putative aldouronate transport system substrate-binding protein